MPDNLINCGECTIRQGKRVVIRSDICERYKLKENDVIEVYIKKVEHNV